jgi:hypothetical protein
MPEMKSELEHRCNSYSPRRKRHRKRRTFECWPSEHERSEVVSRLQSLVDLVQAVPDLRLSWDWEATDPTAIQIAKMRLVRKMRLPSGSERRCEPRSVANEKRR